MTLLTEYGYSLNSQFGEDGIIRQCLTRMSNGEMWEGGRCIEVGASDGQECSNTHALRDMFSWRRVLIEADETLYGRIPGHELDIKYCVTIAPTGVFSLDELVPEGCDFLSLDIDGQDYEVLKNLKMRPALICAEFNPTIPGHLDLVSPQIGCSLKALSRMMLTIKDYSFVGATHCNAFFVRGDDYAKFQYIDTNPEHYLSTDNLTYLISDPYGGVVAFGPQIFGMQKRFAGEIDLVDGFGHAYTIRLGFDSGRPN